MYQDVLGEGPEQADICIVGEAAGAEEARLGRPFVGPAGRLLDDLLRDKGIDRARCYITNLVKEQPDRNDISPWVAEGQLTPRGRDAAEYLRCELSLRKPRVIITLGASAKLGVTDDAKPITKVRGAPILGTGHLAGAVIIPALHPAHILRGAWMDRYLLAADIAKARRMLEAGGRQAIPNRHILIHPSGTEIDQWFKRAAQAQEIGFDIETSNDVCTCFSIALSPTEAISIEDVSRSRLACQYTPIGLLKRLLESPDGPRIVTQNGNYDTTFLRWHYDIKTNLARVEDTMCAHHVMWADLGGDEKETTTGVRVKRSSKSLALLASLYTNEPYYKDEGVSARARGHLDDYLRYNAKDAAVTLECWQSLKQQLEARPGALVTYRDLTMPRLPAVQEMQLGGILVDADEYTTLRKEAVGKVVALDVELQKEVAPFLQQREKEALMRVAKAEAAVSTLLAKYKGVKPAPPDLKEARKEASAARGALAVTDDFNPDSAQQCQELFYGFHKLPIRRNRKTKAPTVDDAALSEFARPTSTRPALPAARLIQQIREQNQQIETFLNWELLHNRFHASFNLRGTKYGRMSSSKLFFRFGGNQQNIPPSVRAVMYADPPRPSCIPFFIEYDLAQAEWVVVAYETGDVSMIAAVENKLDIHAWTAHLMSGVPFEEVLLEEKLFKEQGLGSETSERVIEETRKQFVYPACPGIASAAWKPRNMLYRQAGKKTNHALNYGEGPLTFASMNGVTVADAKRLIELYHRAYPALRDWHNRLQFSLKAVENNHYRRTLTNCFGREMRFLGPLNGQAAEATFRAAYSCIPQSTVADIASNAMVEIVKMPDVALRSNNHDSLLVQHWFAPQAVKSSAERICREMQEVQRHMTPKLRSTVDGCEYQIRVDAKGGRCWGKLGKVVPTVASVVKLIEGIKQEYHI